MIATSTRAPMLSVPRSSKGRGKVALDGVRKSCSRLKLPLFRLFGLFLSARPAEHIRHRIIRLMARVLKKLVAGFLRDGKGDFPRRGEDLRIVNGEFIVHRVRVNTREAFNQTKGVARGYGIAAVSPDTRRVI